MPKRSRLVVAAAVLLAMAACDSTMSEPRDAVHISLAAGFDVASPGHASAASSVDRVRVVFRRLDGRTAIDDVVDWPLDAPSIELGPYRIPLSEASEQFDVSVSGYVGGLLIFGYGPARITARAGESVEMEALLQYLGLDIEPGRDQVVFRLEGGVTGEGALLGEAITLGRLGDAGDDFWFLYAENMERDTIFYIALPGQLRVGSFALGEWDPSYEPDSENATTPAPGAAIWVEEEYTGSYERWLLIASVRGALTITEITTPTGEPMRVRGELVVEATAFTHEWDASVGETITQHAAPVTLRAAFDVPVYEYVSGTATAVFTDGPYPGMATGTYSYADIDMLTGELYVDISGSLPAAFFYVNFRLLEPAPGSFSIDPARGVPSLEVWFYHENGFDYATGNATEGSIQILEYEEPASSWVTGTLRGTATVSVPVEEYIDGQFVPAGTTTADLTFHVPVWRWDGDPIGAGSAAALAGSGPRWRRLQRDTAQGAPPAPRREARPLGK